MSKESCHEGASFSQENLSELQDRASQGCGVRDLYRQETQAAPGLISSAEKPCCGKDLQDLPL
jgi:hypothetical protein